MTEPLVKPSFSSGELAPSLWGRTDYAKFHSGCSVLRNCFVNYRGGGSSRAGLAFVGACKQPGTSLPPRDIPFSFSQNLGFTLEFGDQYMRIVSDGGYLLESSFAITGATQANPAVLTVTGNNFVNGDWVYVRGVQGMTQLNNRTLIVTVSGANVTLRDIFGRQVDSSAYGAFTSGGTVARIYTAVSPYAAADLPYLKYTQSADVMSLTCVNQVTGTEYPPYDLKRISNTNWQFVATSYASSIASPTGAAAVTTTGGTWTYNYVVTAVAANGDESLASNIAAVASVNIATTAGTITVTWNPVVGAAYYNIYKAPASNTAQVPVGALFGYVGTSYGAQFADSNIIADFAVTPPLHNDPFARGQALSANGVSVGSGYHQATTTATIVSGTGTGASLIPIIVGGQVVQIIFQSSGKNYQTGDTISIVDSGGSPGSGANFTLVVGPQSGTFPGTVAYFQQRRIYGYSVNEPDTYWASKTGLYTNMDAGTPAKDSDALTGNPWAQQVNGIQWFIPMPGGLIVATGKSAWQLSGQGGGELTPTSQSAVPQETYGFSATVPPLKIGYNILFPQPFGSTVREIQYNFYANIYAGNDVSFLSNHLLKNHSIKEWAWSAEPNKIVWAVRDDGKFLSFTYLKEQEIAGWARHDTNGLVQSVCSITESPVDAVYFIVKRYIPGVGQWVYYQERMDNRLWEGVEDTFCLDAGVTLPQPTPSANLTISAADGPHSILAGFVIRGGTGYTNPSVIVTDPTGKGTGASVTLSQSGGVINAVTIASPGQNYGSYQVQINDPTGTGAVIGLTINRNVTFTADQDVFSPNDANGTVLRVGGGIGTINAYASARSVTASLNLPIVVTVPNDPNNLPVPAAPGAWTLTVPVTTLTNLEHLEGMTVSILADGSVDPPQVVTNGTITLPNAASSIKVGLPFTAQLQPLHADKGPSAPSIQWQRKKINQAMVRVEASRGIEIGCNEPIASRFAFEPEIPWTNMQQVKDRNPTTAPGNAIPLFTGDYMETVSDDWNLSDYQAAAGMLGVQQRNPLPMNILMLIALTEVGDTPG